MAEEKERVILKRCWSNFKMSDLIPWTKFTSKMQNIWTDLHHQSIESNLLFNLSTWYGQTVWMFRQLGWCSVHQCSITDLPEFQETILTKFCSLQCRRTTTEKSDCVSVAMFEWTSRLSFGKNTIQYSTNCRIILETLNVPDYNFSSSFVIFSSLSKLPAMMPRKRRSPIRRLETNFSPQSSALSIWSVVICRARWRVIRPTEA